MSQDLDDLSEAELAEWQYAHRDELDEEEGELVEAEISPRFSVTLSFRLPGEEADLIRGSAREADMSLSEWIRQACAEAADPRGEGLRRQQIDKALENAQEQLEALRKRLQAARAKNRRMGRTKKRARRATSSAKKTS